MSRTFIDKDRFLIRSASSENITGKWKEVIEDILEACKHHLGSHLISLYVGGSLPLGTAQENKSDVDTYTIVSLSKEQIEKAYDEWVDIERKSLDNKYPFQRGIEIHLISIDSIPENKKFQMKVLAACAYGRDFASELPAYKLDKETLKKIRLSEERDIQIARKDLEKGFFARRNQEDRNMDSQKEHTKCRGSSSLEQ